MAVVHTVGLKDKLEYPIGKVLYETAGYISDPRVSPDGTRVAFLDHQMQYDDRGWVKVVDRAGAVTTVAGEFSGAEGLAWSPDGTLLMVKEGILYGWKRGQPGWKEIVSMERLSLRGVTRLAVSPATVEQYLDGRTLDDFRPRHLRVVGARDTKLDREELALVSLLRSWRIRRARVAA